MFFIYETGTAMMFCNKKAAVNLKKIIFVLNNIFNGLSFTRETGPRLWKPGNNGERHSGNGHLS